MQKKHISTPELLLFDMNIKNNNWIIKARLLYSLFFILYFLVYRYYISTGILALKDILLVFLLVQTGNVLFYFTLRNLTHRKDDSPPLKELISLEKLQVDFDFVIISIIVFISGGLNSPVTFLYILYIVISVFILEKRKIIRNLIYLLVFLTILSFTESNLFDFAGIFKLVSFQIIIIFTFFVSAYISRSIKDNQYILEELLEKSRELSIKDNLSGLYNQRYFFEQLSILVKKSLRYKSAFSLILFDIDNFKIYNDSNGHLKGSAVIEQVGKMVGKAFRDFDICARYGGDEFVVILPETDKVGAYLAADRLRIQIENTEFPGMQTQPMGKITLSIGVSSFPEHANSVEELIERADIALYISKSEGRNRVTIYDSDKSKSPLKNLR